MSFELNDPPATKLRTSRPSRLARRIRERWALGIGVGFALSAGIVGSACHDSSKATSDAKGSPSGSSTTIEPGDANIMIDAPFDAGGLMEHDGPLVKMDAGHPLPNQVDVLTQHNDMGRTGQNLNEVTLTTSNVNPKTFGKLFNIPVTGYVYGQPLIVSNYEIKENDETDFHNVLVVGTAHNNVYAFDADTGSTLWQVNLGPSVPNAAIRGGAGTQNIPIEVGILSTPVIDRENNLIYLTNKTYVNETQELWLHALDLATGNDVPGSPIAITATVPGTGYDGGPTLTLDAPHHAQRPGLLLLKGSVYMAFASHEDWQPYHGWVLGYKYSIANKKFTQTGAWNASADGGESGIWQSGQGLLSDGTSIFGATGNGTVTVQDGGKSAGESFFRLNADTLKLEDWFVPVGYGNLNRGDYDLGSGGTVLFPGTNPPLMGGGGKSGEFYLVDTTNMSHLSTTQTDNVVQVFRATNLIFGSPVVWTGGGDLRMYYWGVGDNIREYVYSADKKAFALPASVISTNDYKNLNGGNPVGNLAVSSNGTKAGTGILWANKPDMDPEHTTVPGRLYAFDALTLEELWDSKEDLDGGVTKGDDYGSFAKFVAPTVANGKVYMATHSQNIYVYGLKSTSGK